MFSNQLLAGAVPLQGRIGNSLFQGTALENFSLVPDASAFFSAVLPQAIALVFVVGALIFFFMLLMGAIQWISSGGDKQALEGARGKISNAFIGLIILFSSYAIIRVIETFFGIHILTLDIGPLVIQ